MVRAAVTAGGTNTWGEELALPVTEFVGAVNERSVPGRLANLRRVPLNVRTVTETSSSTGYWVGEGAAKPVSKMAYTTDVLEPFKVSALVVVTDEVLRSSSPNAEAVVRNDLLNAVVRELNSAFIDEGNAGISGVMPASVTNGLTPISGSGDLAGDPAVFCWPTSREISKRQHSSDTRSFSRRRPAQRLSRPRWTRRRASAAFSAVASSQVSPDMLVLLDADGIAYAEGSAEVRVSRQATIQLLDNPTNNAGTATATQTVSLLQTNAVAASLSRSIW